jgi:hypothetical protein
MEMVSRRMPAAILAALALATGALAGATDARASTYHVYGCRTPGGQPAPADGWSGSTASGGAWDDYAKNTCAEGGALIAALGDQTTHGASVDRATWSFSSPGAASIAAATLYRAGDTAAGGNGAQFYALALAGPGEANIFEPCASALGCPQEGNTAQPLSGVNRVTVPASNIGARLYASAACQGYTGVECPAGTGDSNGYSAALYLYASDITLEQSAGPSVINVGGELASASSLSGTPNLTLSASDAGAGVYELLLSVDGQLVDNQVPNDNGGHCRDVGQASDGRPAFLYIQPCPQSVTAEVKLDTTRLTDGPHHLVATVLDAAGNSAPVLDRTITVANPAPPGCDPPASAATSAAPGASTSAATLSASWNGTGRVRLTTRFGRAPAIVGRLTALSGAPIAGATLELVTTPSYQGAAPLQTPGPQTGPDGRFVVRLPRVASSRAVCVAYRPPGGAPPVIRTLLLNVKAGIALGVSPHVTSVGRTITFHGRLLAGPVPAAGKQLVLEARSPGVPWLEFLLVRTGPRGRFHAIYRFRFPGPASYQFRVLSEPESDYPFAAGYSNEVAVRER